MLDADPTPAATPRRNLPKNLFGLPAAEVLATLEGASRHVQSVHDGVATSLRIWGEGEPVVMLHGASGSWRHFVRNIPVLAEHYQVIIPDIPGFGGSALPPQGIDLPWLAGAIAHGIDDVVGERARYHLVPFSYAGHVAADLVLAHRERIATFTGISPGGLAKIEIPPVLSLRGKQGAERAATHRINLKNLMIAADAKIDDLSVMIQDLNTVESRLDLRHVRRRTLLKDALAGSTMPILGMWGSHDQFTMNNNKLRMDTLTTVRPDADIVEIARCGHWAMYEQPDEVNALVLAALGKVRI
jgi:pimeloyl-ACP methyl ester carboxylesterase